MIARILTSIRSRWHDESGYRVVLRMALPLILSTGSWSLQQFVDRMFLSWHSPESIAAVMPAGMVNFCLFSLLIGTAAYTNTFVAQYHGASRPQRIGAAVWQGLYLTLSAIALVALVYPFSGWFFRIMGHAPAVVEAEISYFRILLFGAPAVVIVNACSGFFSGLGRPWVIFWADIIATLVNIVLDYLWIFGKAGFPAMGIAGAAYATVVAMSVSALLLFVLMTRRSYARSHRTRSAWRFNPDLFRRLVRFGFPNGLQMFLESLAFTIFILIVGRLGTSHLAATNIAFNINSLAFVPMFGMMTAVTALVGQALGKDLPDKAEELTWSALHLAMAYFGTLAAGYFFLPQIFLYPFGLTSGSFEMAQIHDIAALLLRFVAVYCLFDAMNMIFSAALKGAGDTRYVAATTIYLAWLVMVIPSIIGWQLQLRSIYLLWLFLTLYVMSLGLVFRRRFRNGPWKEMRVIEQGGANLPD